jgi:hypothetical protein
VVEAQVWTLIGLLATALFTLLGQMRGLEKRVSDLSAEMHRGFGEIRGDIAVLRAQINRDQG